MNQYRHAMDRRGTSASSVYMPPSLNSVERAFRQPKDRSASANATAVLRAPRGMSTSAQHSMSKSSQVRRTHRVRNMSASNWGMVAMPVTNSTEAASSPATTRPAAIWRCRRNIGRAR